MNEAHLHLMVIHFPVAGIILAVPLLLAGWWLKNEVLKATGLALVVAVGLLGYAAFETGEDAAGFVRNLPDILRENIHEHALAAKFALGWMALDAVLASVGLFAFWKHRKVSGWVFAAVTVLTLFTSTVVARTAYLGGHIHHPETLSGFVPPAQGPK